MPNNKPNQSGGGTPNQSGSPSDIVESLGVYSSGPSATVYIDEQKRRIKETQAELMVTDPSNFQEAVTLQQRLIKHQQSLIVAEYGPAGAARHIKQAMSSPAVNKLSYGYLGADPAMNEIARQQTFRDIYETQAQLSQTVDPRGITREHQALRERQASLINRAAAIDLGERQHTEYSRAKELLDVNRQRKEFESTGKITVGGEQLKASQVYDKLIEKTDELVRVFDTLRENSEKLTDQEAQELIHKKENLSKDISDLTKASQVTGGGGGGRRGVLGVGIGQALMLGGETLRELAVNQQMQQVANQTGYARIENQKYNLYKAARSGDIASQLALMNIDEAQNFARGMRANASVSDYMSAGGQIVAGGALMFGAGAETIGTAGLGAGLGLIASGYGASQAISGATNLVGAFRGVKSGAAELAAFQAYMGQSQEMQAVRAEQMQNLRNFMVNSGVSAQGLGGFGGTLLDSVTLERERRQDLAANKANSSQLVSNQFILSNDALRASDAQSIANTYVGRDPIMVAGNKSVLPSNTENILDRLAQTGVGLEQYGQLVNFATQTMGRAGFNEQGEVGVRGLRQLERYGLGSVEQNLSRQAQLFQAGGQNPQANLEQVIAAGMTKGLQDAPSIKAMVDNTAALSRMSGATAAGMDVTGIVGAQLAAAIDPDLAGKNAPLAAQIAASNLQLSNQWQTNTSTTFTGMFNTARLQEQLGKYGVNGEGAIALGKQDAAFFSAINAMGTPEEKIKALQGIGINATTNNVNDIISTAIRDKKMQVIEAGGVTGALGGLSPTIINKLLKDEELSDTEFTRVGKVAGLMGKTAPQLLGMIRAVDKTTNTDEIKDTLSPEARKQADMLDKQRLDANKQQIEAAKQAATELNKFGGALEIFNQMVSKYSNKGPVAEKEFQDAAINAAKDFQNAANIFGNNVGLFKSAVETFTGRTVTATNNLPSTNAGKEIPAGATARGARGVGGY
jgi:hypothetical protein